MFFNIFSKDLSFFSDVRIPMDRAFLILEISSCLLGISSSILYRVRIINFFVGENFLAIDFFVGEKFLAIDFLSYRFFCYRKILGYRSFCWRKILGYRFFEL